MIEERIDLGSLTDAMLNSFAGLAALTGSDDMRVGVEGARLLATRGEPTTAAGMAASLNLPEQHVDEILDSFVETGFAFRDENGTVLAMWGVTAPGTAIPGSAHRFTIEARNAPMVYAWCALDTLYLSYMFDAPLRVWSICPITRRSITFIVKPDGAVRGLTPSRAVLSALIPDGPVTKDVRNTFCHFVNFFAHEDAGREWAEKQPVTVTLLDVATAAEWARRHHDDLFSVHEHRTSGHAHR